MSFELTVNNDAFAVDSLDGLRAHLAPLYENQFAEVWLRPPGGWPTLTALVNGPAAWLMCMRYEGDAGFSTRNPAYSGPEGAMVEFYLSNGQRDEYPASWNITTTEAVRAMEYFLSHLQRAPWLSWHED